MAADIPGAIFAVVLYSKKSVFILTLGEIRVIVRFQKRLYIICICVAIATGVSSGGYSQNDAASVRVTQWADSLVLDDRVIEEIERFAADEDEGFGKGYAGNLAADLRRIVFADVTRRLDAITAGKIDPFVEASYPEAGFARTDEGKPDLKAERKFEESFVRTELVAVFKNNDISPETALRVYTSAEFRKKASSRIERIWDEDGLNCVETTGVTMLLSPMLSCSRVSELISTGLAVQHSQVVGNGGSDGYQPVYFKESVKTFVRVPGGLVLHYINYSRTVGMGGLKKSIGRKKIKGSQEDAIESFRSTIGPEAGDSG
ncbi:MAG: hypothetical protein JSW50_15195 [Candidatus Latescibacterota bacterium]|nr:MAG: hypothetical protein JSW50_15195 [Candidatus Latescibacterota bacterium]